MAEDGRITRYHQLGCRQVVKAPGFDPGIR